MSKFVAALAALAISGSAAAQTPSPEEEVNQLLDTVAQTYVNDGYTSTGWEHRGSLAAGQSERVTLTLSGGHSYDVVGICDGDCDNIDIQLYDAGGHEVSHDTTSDDTPIVKVSASGTYTAQITMVSCAERTCKYGMKAFQN